MKKGKSDVFIEIIFVCENTKLKLPLIQIIFYVKVSFDSSFSFGWRINFILFFLHAGVLAIFCGKEARQEGYISGAL